MKRTSLTDEQREALAREADGIEIEDPQTQKVYVLVEADSYRRAMEALSRREIARQFEEASRTWKRDAWFPSDLDRHIRAKLAQDQTS